MRDSQVMEMGRPWKWTRRFAVGLSASVAGFSAFNFIAPFLPHEVDAPGGSATVANVVAALLLASLVGNAQGLANCMAANARRVGAAGHVVAGRWCWVFCLGFAAVSWFGLHNAWEMVRVNATNYAFPHPILMDALFLFVALSEPTMNWIVDLLKALHKAELVAEEMAVRETAIDRESRQRDAEERRRGFHAVSTGAAAAAIAIGSVAMPAEAFPLDPIVHSAPASVEAEAHHSHGWRGPRDQAKWELVMEGRRQRLKPVEISRDTGVPISTVCRWLSKVEAAA